MTPSIILGFHTHSPPAGFFEVAMPKKYKKSLKFRFSKCGSQRDAQITFVPVEKKPFFNVSTQAGNKNKKRFFFLYGSNSYPGAPVGGRQ
jgi:hypothetical protein